MATSWISFGPDLEPLESEARRGAQTAARRRDGISVEGSAEEVTRKLSEASGTGWCRFEDVRDGNRRPVYVNGAMARLVVDEVA